MTNLELVTLLHTLLDGEDYAGVREACDAVDPQVAVAALALVLGEQPAAHGVRALSQVDPELAAPVLQHLNGELAAEILAELEEPQRTPILDLLDAPTLSRLVGEMQSDEATDVMQDLGPTEAAAVAARLDPEMRAAVRELAAYDETSAGGLMAKEFATVPVGVTTGEALARLRAGAQDVEDLEVIYAVDPAGKLVGACSLRDLVMSEPGERVAELVTRHRHWVGAQQDQEEVAQYMLAHDLDAVPVLNEAGHVIGQITLDDAADVIEQEASEDIQRLTGLRGDETVFSPLAASVRRRLPWLAVNIPLAMMASAMVYVFRDAVGHLPTIVAFLPIAGGIAGNAAGQTVSVFVRGLAMRETTLGDMWRCIARQSLLGLVLGLALGVAVAALQVSLGNAVSMAGIAMLAVLLNCTTACFTGTILPFMLRKVGQDPAMGANLVTTSITDATGYAYVLGLASLALAWHLIV